MWRHIIYSQFHHHYTRAFFVRIFCQSKIVTRNLTREKLPNWCSYEKIVPITLMKLTPSLPLPDPGFLITLSDVKFPAVELQTTFFLQFFSNFFFKCQQKLIQRIRLNNLNFLLRLVDESGGVHSYQIDLTRWSNIGRLALQS